MEGFSLGLIAGPSEPAPEVCAEILRELRAEFVAILRMTEKAPATIPNPWAVETSGRVAREAIALADWVLSPPTSAIELMAVVVNMLYEVRNANAYLVRAAKLSPSPLLPPPNRPTGPQ